MAAFHILQMRSCVKRPGLELTGEAAHLVFVRLVGTGQKELAKVAPAAFKPQGASPASILLHARPLMKPHHHCAHIRAHDGTPPMAAALAHEHMWCWSRQRSAGANRRGSTQVRRPHPQPPAAKALRRLRQATARSCRVTPAYGVAVDDWRLLPQRDHDIKGSSAVLDEPRPLDIQRGPSHPSPDLNLQIS